MFKNMKSKKQLAFLLIIILCFKPFTELLSISAYAYETFSKILMTEQTENELAEAGLDEEVISSQEEPIEETEFEHETVKPSPFILSIKAGDEDYRQGQWKSEDVIINLDPSEDYEYIVTYNTTVPEADDGEWGILGSDFIEVQEDFVNAYYWFKLLGESSNDGVFGGILVCIDKETPDTLRIQYNNEEIKIPQSTETVEKFYDAAVLVTFYAKDSGSGIDEFVYSKNQEEERSIKVTQGPDESGFYYVQFRLDSGFVGYLSVNARDKAGNQAEADKVRDASFAVDIEQPGQPSVAMISNGNSYDGSIFTPKDVVIELRKPSNVNSGIHHYEYAVVNNSDTLPTDDDWQVIVAEDEEIEEGDEDTSASIDEIKFTIRDNCEAFYYFRAVSNANVIGITSSLYPIKIDKDDPLPIDAIITGEIINGWYTSSPNIEIPSIVPQTGKSPVHACYQIWKEGEVEPLDQGIYNEAENRRPRINNEGKYTLVVWAENTVNNVSPEKTYYINIDTTAPINLEVKYEEQEAVEFLRTSSITNFFNSNLINVGLTIEDVYSGIDRFTYKIGDGNEESLNAVKINGKYQAEFEVGPQFLGSISVNAIDMVGHKYSVDLTQYAYVAVDDKTPVNPEVEAKVEGNNYNQRWTNKDVDINVIGEQVNNVISGLNHYEYTTTDGNTPSDHASWSSISYGDTIIRAGSRMEPSNADRAGLKVEADTFASYYFRAVSNTGVKGNITEGVPVRVYKTPPRSPNVSIANESANGWYNRDPIVSINKMEVTSRQPRISIYYKLWKTNEAEPDNFTTYQSNGDLIGQIPQIEEEAKYTLKVWSEDEAGNLNQEDTIKDIKLDKTPPKIRIAYPSTFNINNGIYFSSARTATVIVEDINFDPTEVSISYNSSSGEAYPSQLNLDTDWTLDDQTGLYTADLLFDPDDEQLGSERYSFQIKVSDYAGNSATLDLQEFIVDETIPVIDFTGTQDNVISWNRDLKLEAMTGDSGIRKIEMFRNGILVNEIFKDEQNSFNKSANTMLTNYMKTIEENGVYTFRVTNKAGTVTQIMQGASYTNIDRQKPVLSLDSNGYNDGKWTSDTVTIDLSNNTNNLGNTVYFYKTSPSGQWIKFNGVLTIDEDLEGTYYFYAESQAQYFTKSEKENIAEIDNTFKAALCDVKSIKIKVDTTYPEDLTVKYESIKPELFADTVSFNHFFADSMLVTLEAYDDFSGIKAFEVVLNHMDGTETWNTYDIDNESSGSAIVEFLINPQFVGSIEVAAWDMAGLRIPKTGTSQYASFAIDAKAPTAPLISSGDEKSGKWTNKDTKLVITNSKADSGVAYYEYIDLQEGMPNPNAKWIVLPQTKATPSDRSTPKNVLETELNLTEDTHTTYYVRGVNNAGTAGQISSYIANIQKTPPPNGQLICEPANEFGWYNHIPSIEIIAPAATPAPVTLYYKLWNTAIGETENSVPEVAFNGTNLPIFPGDGEYVLWIWTMDEAGNRCLASEDIRQEIKMDRMLPSVTLQFDNNNVLNEVYYDAWRTATIVVEELNFDTEKCVILAENKASELEGIPLISTWSSIGIRHTATVAFFGDGDYSLSFQIMDKAGNIAQVPEEQRFVIDTILPQLRIDGVIDKTANRDPLIPQIIYSDVNLDLDQSTITLEGYTTKDQKQIGVTTEENGVKTFTFNPIDVDDNYKLTATIYDKAGNMKTESIIFSVNQFGATFVFENREEIQGQYINTPFRPSIQVWNVDEVTIVSFTVNGEDKDFQFQDGVVTLDEEINVEGKYVIALDTKDAAGNANTMIPIEFYYDDVKPVNQITGVNNGKYMFEEVTVGVVTIDSSNVITEIMVNEEVLTEDDYIYNEDNSIEFLLEDVGKYHITVSSQDIAGNKSDKEELTFEISDSWILKLWYGIVKFFSV